MREKAAERPPFVRRQDGSGLEVLALAGKSDIRAAERSMESNLVVGAGSPTRRFSSAVEQRFQTGRSEFNPQPAPANRPDQAKPATLGYQAANNRSRIVRKTRGLLQDSIATKGAKRGGRRKFGTAHELGRSVKSKSAPTKRLLALGLAVTLSFSAICGGVLWTMGERDFEHNRDAAANLVTSIASGSIATSSFYDLSLQAALMESSCRRSTTSRRNCARSCCSTAPPPQRIWAPSWHWTPAAR